MATTTLTAETIARVAKKIGYLKLKNGGFAIPCPRCHGTGVFRPFGVCFRCGGGRWEEVGHRTVLKNVRAELELEAQRERNGGKTDGELRWEAQQADLQAQRDRNGGLTDLELSEKQAKADGAAAELATRYTPGTRQGFSGTITMRVSGPGKFGTWVLTKIKLENGDTAIYWNDLGDKGDAVSFTATVKEISTRNGEAQVVVQRAKLAQPA